MDSAKLKFPVKTEDENPTTFPIKKPPHSFNKLGGVAHLIISSQCKSRTRSYSVPCLPPTHPWFEPKNHKTQQ